MDSGYRNQVGYLAPYKGTKYHLQEYRNAAPPQGMEETFNYAHSSLRNVVERSIGVLKMKRRMLKEIPAYAPDKQSKSYRPHVHCIISLGIVAYRIDTSAAVIVMKIMSQMKHRRINRTQKCLMNRTA